MEIKTVVRFIGICAFAIMVSGCKTPGSAEGGQSAAGTTSQNTAAAAWTGDGGEGKSIAILSPRASGLAEDQDYLPLLVQGELVSNFSSFSAISVLDRVNLDNQYGELFSGYYDDDAAELADLGHLVPTDYLLGGTITRTETGYALQIQITKNDDKTTAGSYSGTSSFVELDNLSGVRKASLDLLQDLKVELTAQSKTELAGAAAVNHVGAQTALARGINAQKQGTEVAALSYYYNATALDSGLAEAANRSSIMFANVSSGNIGEDTRNDIAWRRDWVARLTETEQFFDNLIDSNSVPYTLFYSTEIIAGAVNYQTETQDLSINTNLRPVGVWTWLDSLERALGTIQDGLNETGRKDTWGLGNWPGSGVTDLRPFESRDKTFTIRAELLNSDNKVIGSTEFRAGGSVNFRSFSASGDDRQQVRFANVNANDITDRLTIRIARVNGMDAETAARTGVLQIKAISKEQWDENLLFALNRNEITRYTGNDTSLVIPLVWDEPVMTIAEDVFRDRGLTSVTIPEGVTSIGDEAFYNNPGLNRIILPDSVKTIGDAVFIYPGDYMSILGSTSGDSGARVGTTGVAITIGADVTMGQEGVIGNRQTHNGLLGPYTNDFLEAYKTNGKGTYTFTLIREFYLKWVWIHTP